MRGMRLLRAAIYHLLGISVVSGDNHLAAAFQHSAHHAADAYVQRLDRLDCRSQIAAVADHVAVGVVAHNGLVLAATDGRF